MNIYRKLTVYPRGNVKFKGKALSVFLELVEAEKLPPKRKVYTEYKLRVRNQINENHKEFTGKLTLFFSYSISSSLRLTIIKTSSPNIVPSLAIKQEYLPKRY